MTQREDEIRENGYMDGRRAVWLKLLAEACIALGVNEPAVEQVKWISEREDTLRELRELYRNHAGEDMPEGVYMADVVKGFGQWLVADGVEE